MATLTNPLYRKSPTIGLFGSSKVIDSGDVAVGTSDIALNGLIKLFQVRKGQVVTGCSFASTDLDTNVAPAIVFAVGDTGSATRFMASLTVGQAGGFSNAMQQAGYGYKFTADTDIYAKVTTAAGTAAAGTIRCMMHVYDAEV